MTALRAFLMLRQSEDDWSISVHRDLDGVLNAWKDRANPDGMTGVLHVGFDRPPARTFEKLACVHSGRLLLTGAARYALPLDFSATVQPIGYTESLPVFLATKGWGYLVDDMALEAVTLFPVEVANPATGWVRDFLNEHVDAVTVFADAGIYDESSYQVSEALLGPEYRYLSGLYRFKALVGSERQNPCEFARAAPPWLSWQRVEMLDLTVRLSNVFSVLRINIVRDLGEFSLDSLLKTQNFGRKSVTDLLSALEQALGNGPPISELSEVSKGPELGLLASIRQSLTDYSARERDIIGRRMGLNGPAQTLQEIGESYDITRERVRQIEGKVLKHLLVRTSWKDKLSSKLADLLKDREVPMPMLGIEAADVWFSGVAQSRDVLKYALANILDNAAGSIVSVDGVDYVCFMTQERWETAISEAQSLLESGAGKSWTESYCRLMTQALLPSAAKEFGSLIWDKATRFCHFVTGTQGERVLSTYGRGAESLVEAVLQASDTPLHYTEIATLAKQRARRDIDPRRVHNAASEVGLLFARGTYGLTKHLPLTSDAMDTLAVEAEELISDGAADRQWHAEEILAGLVERGSKSASEANKYIVDIALQRQGILKRLGRMVWATGAEATDIARIDIRQAIIAVLKQAGRPLNANDIKQRLIAVRGMDPHFQIFAADPLLRTAPGQWGLNDRDFIVKRPQQPALVECIVKELERRSEGLHITELQRVLSDVIQKTGSAVEIYSLASLSAQLRTDAGQYLYLGEWGESRRESIPEAVASVLQSATGALPIEQIVQAVERRTKRPCERSAVSGCLKSLGAYFNSETLLWMIPSDRAPDTDEELEIPA